MPLLIKFKKDWADECDVFGMSIYDSQEAWQKAFSHVNDNNFSFGTNEGWEAGEFSFEDFTVIEITAEQAEFLITVFGYGKKYWGHSPL